MSDLKQARGKPRAATDNEMEILQPLIQKGLAKWRSQIKNARLLRELFELNGNFVVFLRDMMDDDDAEACVVNATIWRAQTGKYYGEVVSAKFAYKYLRGADEDAEAEAEMDA